MMPSSLDKTICPHNGRAVGVGGVLGDRERGVEDRLEGVDRFAFGDGHDFGAVLAVLV
jgi:hypothetical protein